MKVVTLMKHKKFEKFSRSHEMSIGFMFISFTSISYKLHEMSINFMLKFEQLYQIAKSHKMEVFSGVLAHRLLNNANLHEEKKQLVLVKRTK